MLEATLTARNGHINGYHGSDSRDRTAQIFEPVIDIPPASQVSDESASVAAESPVAPQTQPTTKATSKVNARRDKAKGRRRNTTKGKKAAKKTKSARPKIKYVPQAELDAEVAKLEALSRAARSGETAALDKLRRALDDCYPHVWRRLADFQIQVERKLIALVAGEDPLRVEAFRKRCSELRHDLLEGASSSLATKMAASRVVTTWMFVQYLELRVLESSDKRWPMKDLELAERRYQTAMRTFGQARQLDMQLQRLAQQGNRRSDNGKQH